MSIQPEQGAAHALENDCPIRGVFLNLRRFIFLPGMDQRGRKFAL